MKKMKRKNVKQKRKRKKAVVLNSLVSLQRHALSGGKNRNRERSSAI